MKSLSIILTAISLGVSPLLVQAKPVMAAAQAQQVTASTWVTGKDAVASIRQKYTEGKYDAFLKEIDASYKKAKEANKLAELAAMRPGFSIELQEWESQTASLREEKNKALLATVAGQEQTPFVQKVESVAHTATTPREEQSIDRLAMFRQMTPGTGKNSEENSLIDLDLEYEYKALHLDLPGADIVEKKEKHCALKMEKLQRAEQLAQQFTNQGLKEDIQAYAEHFDARLAQNWDLIDLNHLANKRIKPANALEEKVASTLNLYQEKFSDFMKQFIAEHEQK